MLRYFIKLAIRKFQSNRVVFTGSIITVSIGALCISLLFSYVYNELTMDGFHKHEKEIYMIVCQASPKSRYDPIEASLFFKFNYKDYPELENLVSLKKYPKGDLKVSYGESVFSPEVLIADSTFFSVFDFNLLTGNKKTILSHPGNALITEDYALKVFGDKNPIGQEIKVTASDIKTYTINGIIERLPSNSSITFDLILPNQFNTYDRMGADFLLVNKKFNKEAFVRKIENIGHSHPQFTESKLGVVAFNDIYFNKSLNNPNYSIFTHFGDKKNIYVLLVIMIIIMTITVLNFTGLQVIMINANVKNIGMSKLMGLGSRGFVMQKAVEIMLLISLSTFIITFAYVAVLPYFNSLAQSMLSPSLWKILTLNLAIIATLFAFAIIYPVVIALKVPISESLKGKIFSGSFLLSQKSIVTIQYALTITLIIDFLVIFKQLSLMLNKDLGFDSENAIRVKMFQRLPFAGGMDEKIGRASCRERVSNFV
jgi:putative ABC transport system permease protein